MPPPDRRRRSGGVVLMDEAVAPEVPIVEHTTALTPEEERAVRFFESRIEPYRICHPYRSSSWVNYDGSLGPHAYEKLAGSMVVEYRTPPTRFAIPLIANWPLEALKEVTKGKLPFDPDENLLGDYSCTYDPDVLRTNDGGRKKIMEHLEHNPDEVVNYLRASYAIPFSLMGTEEHGCPFVQYNPFVIASLMRNPLARLEGSLDMYVVVLSCFFNPYHPKYGLIKTIAEHIDGIPVGTS